jgi:hypothetical protein
MHPDVHSEIVRLDRIAKRARAHRARGEARGDFVLEMRAARLEAAAEARLDATVCGDATTDDRACTLSANSSLEGVD